MQMFPRTQSHGNDILLGHEINEFLVYVFSIRLASLGYGCDVGVREYTHCLL